MLCALPEPYYAHRHQRRAAVGCVRIAFKWIFDGFRPDRECKGLDLYLEPTKESWIQHEVDILSHLGWAIGRYFAPVGLPSALATPRPLLAAVAPHVVSKGTARGKVRPRDDTDAATADTSGKRRGRSARRRPPAPTPEPDGPPTGDHAAVSLIPRRRPRQATDGPSWPSSLASPVPLQQPPSTTTCQAPSSSISSNRSTTLATMPTTTTIAVAVGAVPVSAFYRGEGDAGGRTGPQADGAIDKDGAAARAPSMRDAAAPPFAARRRAASSESERSARSRYANRTSAEARSMAHASARSTSTSTGSVPRAVTQPLAFHVGM
ncbi:Ribonuclease H [Pandoravirus dulcis]|uniref:Ribonuclease H n=1 Tax=Pandoravirus dulcis TaxID=1349409 RepID=S4VPW7_9VIRU|nr:Ribonuclease H [Pandoravirus dulcis]AGO82358.2 Ribonuclease H [Pandoravirus dulcis]